MCYNPGMQTHEATDTTAAPGRPEGSIRWVRLTAAAGLLSALWLASGCVSTTGPFISELQRDARGNLIITECHLEVTTFGEWGHRSQLKNCTQYMLLFETPPAPGAWAPMKVKMPHNPPQTGVPVEPETEPPAATETTPDRNQ